MKKEIYQDIENNVKRAEYCSYNYKEHGLNFSEYKKILKSRKEEINYKRFQRKQILDIPEFESNYKTAIERKKELFKEVLENLVKTNQGVKIIDSEVFSTEIDEEADWNYYAKSYRFPKIWKTTNFSFPINNFKGKYIKYLQIDGIVNIEIISEEKENDFVILQTISIVRKKIENSMQWVNKKMYIAVKGQFAYHSEKSIKNAIAGLKRKLKKEQDKIVYPETLITSKKYHKITGACWAGINDFLNRFGFSENDSMPAKDLLPLLKKNNEWGWKKLEKSIIE